MVEQEPSGPRARYRQQVKAEVKTHAWQQIADAGASGLSLKAIATQMGMTAPALYRYFANRDELLTELILTAYRQLAEAVEADVSDADPPEQQLRRIAAAFRQWSVSHPHRYLLLYGTPVPGYAAPPEATTLATRIFRPLVNAFDRAGAADAFARSVVFWTRLHGVLSLDLAGHFTGMGIDTERLYDDEVNSAIAAPE
jgi:AcrR family transcriptional regulator